MVLLKERANLSRYTISGAAVNQKHGSPMPVVCIYMFIEVYIICDCKAVFVMREDREWRSGRRGDLHLPQPFLLFIYLLNVTSLCILVASLHKRSDAELYGCFFKSCDPCVTQNSRSSGNYVSFRLPIFQPILFVAIINISNENDPLLETRRSICWKSV